MNPAATRGEVSCTTVAMSAQSKERQDEHDHDDQADKVDETIHLHPPPGSLVDPTRQRGDKCSCTRAPAPREETNLGLGVTRIKTPTHKSSSMSGSPRHRPPMCNRSKCDDGPAADIAMKKDRNALLPLRL